MKEKLKELFYMPILPIGAFFAITYCIIQIYKNGIFGFASNGIDEKDIQEFKDNHYHPILQKTLAAATWIFIIRFVFKLFTS